MTYTWPLCKHRHASSGCARSVTGCEATGDLGKPLLNCGIQLKGLRTFLTFFSSSFFVSGPRRTSPEGPSHLIIQYRPRYLELHAQEGLIRMVHLATGGCFARGRGAVSSSRPG